MPLWEKTHNHYYSINIGLVHIATFDFDFFTSNPHLQSTMLHWLENDLKRANKVRNKWPWIILINHKPLHCSDLVNYGPECRIYWTEYREVDHLINKYKVDLFISGHKHSYERLIEFSFVNSQHIIHCFSYRSLPVYQRAVKDHEKVAGDDKYTYIVDPQAPIHIVEAIAGNQETHHLKPCKHKLLLALVN